MNKKPNTKRALTLSLLSLLLCVSLLVGSTFAWFTDVETTNVNKIQSGILEIDLLDESGNNLEGATLKFVDMDENVYWEPGATYTLPTVYIQNNGNLAVKYKVEITGIQGDAKLNEVIDWTITYGYATGETEGHLVPGQKVPVTISGKMQTTAGNEYQNLTIDSIAITVLATQDTVEFDSTTNQYDANATYAEVIHATNQAELTNELKSIPAEEKVVAVALPAGTYNFTDAGTALQNKDITFSGSEETVFDMSSQQGVNAVQDLIGTTITFDGVTVIWSEENEGYQGVKNPGHVIYKNCTIKGTQFMYSGADFINCTFITANGYAVYTRANGNYTFTDCDFQTGGRAIMMYHDSPVNANVTLTNCTFSDDGTYSSKAKAVVETGDIQSASVFNITINNCTITKGFEPNNSTSALWGNKDNMPKDRLNVVIDGEDVY